MSGPVTFITYRAYLEHFIERLPLETERKAQKVLYLCESRGMTDQGELTITTDNLSFAYWQIYSKKTSLLLVHINMFCWKHVH